MILRLRKSLFSLSLSHPFRSVSVRVCPFPEYRHGAVASLPRRQIIREADRAMTEEEMNKVVREAYAAADEARRDNRTHLFVLGCYHLILFLNTYENLLSKFLSPYQ